MKYPATARGSRWPWPPHGAGHRACRIAASASRRMSRRGFFRKFQRGEQAVKLGIKGTGIGLAMVDAHRQSASRPRQVESEPGKGSTFTIVLPGRE